ncbi:malonyl CoA-acyl carrier protein transacylase [Liquorilactobacillus sucicola DSM 21376 = JCM 15457]|uniref:Malonyl CoA-acyl carrier protein transacylase n=1 Tax=Liquorilactobacillus sucicola DSM 21376 = JCM 15457 TaxID=1423806 RepID=A0A023CWR6_9LACO|nr:ACP S-malonyltransferase [Liquorilactobacillus sucicola]KRN06048.1 malonyl-CoA-[acyl-carrier-protein] transacylase [Liquorilactobacillus sucicola DSM 21376 = JCM 15457]GAJ25975.1 malonyl CoA-acyl carrier protein transacylase [Liquorilactobacillus sucicola DSM 21376 = JCM 15457]
MKIGFLFSGQGAQYSKMGLDLYESDQVYRETIDQAAELTGMDLGTIYRNENNELAQTVYVQPAIVAMSLGIMRMLNRDVPQLDVHGMVGLSLGEYSALIAANSLSFEEGMQVLKDRAMYMQNDAEETDGAMVAVMKTDIETIKNICKEASNDTEVVCPANYNSPKQVVIGGNKAAVDRAIKLFHEQEIKNVIPLKVSGAFHTPLFKKASTLMEKRLAGVQFEKTIVPVISNTTAQPFQAEETREILTRQLISPTHFYQCVDYMIKELGIDTVVEIGPGQTLSKFTRQIDKKIERYHIDGQANYQKFIEASRG